MLDASVLIALARIRHLDLVRRTYGRAVIGPVVFEEVVTAGKRVGALGVEQVEHAIGLGWLSVVTPTLTERRLIKRILNTSRLHGGEAESIAIAKRRKLPVILDDKEARGVAGAHGLDLMGTAGMLLEAYFAGHLNLDLLAGILMELSAVMWLSPRVVAAVLKLAREERR